MFRINSTTAAFMLSLIYTFSAWAVETDKPTISNPVIDQVFAKYEKAFNAGDAKAIGALWEKDGEFVDPMGNRIVGREAIEKLFQDFFKMNPGRKLILKLLSLKEEESGKVVITQIIPVISPPLPGEPGQNKATIVLVRSGENWLIEGVKESLHQPAAYEHLKALEWLVGNWVAKSESAAEPEKTNQISINTTFQWTANKSFITRVFNTQTKQFELNGTEVIAWDPLSKSIRSWTFESTGGFTESAWKIDGNKCVIEMKGVLADGEKVSSTSTVVKVDDNTITLQSQKRMRGGQAQPDIEPLTIKRVVPAESSTPAR
jgi:uncharacterized protein (TIGR02246 family)